MRPVSWRLLRHEGKYEPVSLHGEWHTTWPFISQQEWLAQIEDNGTITCLFGSLDFDHFHGSGPTRVTLPLIDVLLV